MEKIILQKKKILRNSPQTYVLGKIIQENLRRKVGENSGIHENVMFPEKSLISHTIQNEIKS